MSAVDIRRGEALPDFIRRVRSEKGLSTADVEKNSGFTVTDGYVSHIENGRVKNVSPEKLRALAKGLQISEDVIFAVARGEAGKARIPLTDEELSPELAANVELLVGMFLDIPRECQLDTLASLSGVWQRRAEHKRIHERHEERDKTRAALEAQARKGRKRRPGGRDAANGPVIVATPLGTPRRGEKPILPRRNDEDDEQEKKTA